MKSERLFSRREIQQAVRRIGAEIRADLAGQRPVLVGILKGCFVFLADLVREIDVPFDVDFVRARSYGTSTRSSGAVEITMALETEVQGRHLVLVEDILDTGLTLDVVEQRLRAGMPASVRRCALLVREGAREPDYMGMWVGPGFVVGYGIDCAEDYRGLRDIRTLLHT